MSCEQSVHVIEQMLMMSYSAVCLEVFICALSYLVSPEEPLVGITLKGLRHQRSEPWTVFARRLQQLEKSKTTAQHQWK